MGACPMSPCGSSNAGHIKIGENVSRRCSCVASLRSLTRVSGYSSPGCDTAWTRFVSGSVLPRRTAGLVAAPAPTVNSAPATKEKF